MLTLCVNYGVVGLAGRTILSFVSVNELRKGQKLCCAHCLIPFITVYKNLDVDLVLLMSIRIKVVTLRIEVVTIRIEVVTMFRITGLFMMSVA